MHAAGLSNRVSPSVLFTQLIVKVHVIRSSSTEVVLGWRQTDWHSRLPQRWPEGSPPPIHQEAEKICINFMRYRKKNCRYRHDIVRFMASIFQ